MNIKLHPQFVKAFDKRITKNPKLVAKVSERVKLFRENRSNPILKNHQLTGKKKNFRAFSITGDVRIIYQDVSRDEVIFLDIGSHNQVY